MRGFISDKIVVSKRNKRLLTAAAAALPLSGMLLSQSAWAANTEQNVNNGSADLTNAASYTPTGVPTVASDVTFNAVTYTPAAFTLNSSQTFGSLNDLSSTALTISNTSSSGTGDTLTLGGTGDLGDGVLGSNSSDLLFVNTGSNLTLTGGSGVTALGLVLGQSGNFDVSGTATISSAITSTGTANLTRTGLGLLTLSGGINNTGSFTNSGTAPTIYPIVGIAAPPAGSTYINGTVGASVTGIVQNGTSDLVLNNLGSTYNAGITIQNGAVLISVGANALGATTDTVYLGNGSTTSNATLDYAGNIAGSGGANHTFVNPITVGSKTGEGVNVISASDYNLTLNGPISLTGGDLTLAPFNTGSSTITVTGGITGTGNVFVSDVDNKNSNIVTLSGSQINNNGTITFNNAPINGVLATAANTGTNVVSANIGSSVKQVIENSTDPLQLSGANAYTGPTTILTGTINETGGSLASTTLNVGAGTFNYSKTGGTQGFTTTNLTAGATINNTSATATLNLGTVSRPVGTAVDFGITGTVNIVNANTGTTILGGWATTGGGANWAVSGGNGSTAGAITALGVYTTANATAAADNGADIDVNFSTATNTTASGAITPNSIRFSGAAANTLTLTGTNVVATGGILVTPSVVGNASTIAGGTLEGSSGGDLVVNQWDSNAAGTLTISSTIANNGNATALTKAGPGKLILSTNNSYTGGTYIVGGTLAVTADGQLGGGTSGSPTTITINGGTLLDNAAASFTLGSGHILSIGSSGGGISSTGGFNQSMVLGTTNQLTGSGTLTLNGTGAANSSLVVSASQSGFTGNIVINTGRLELNTNGVTSPLGSGTITIVSGATLGASIVTNSNTGNTITNTIYVAGNGDNGAIHSKAAGGTTNTFSGPIILTANASFYDDVNSTSITAFSGGISGPYTLTLSGSGSYVLSGVDTEAALTLNNNGGTTQLSGSGTLGAPNVTLNFSQNGAKLDLNGTNQTIGTINNNTATILNNGSQASTLTINGGGTTATAFNNGSNTLGLTVGGASTLTLSASSSYSGGTTINGGTLALTPASPSVNNIASSKFINVGNAAALNVTNVGGAAQTRSR